EFSLLLGLRGDVRPGYGLESVASRPKLLDDAIAKHVRPCFRITNQLAAFLQCGLNRRLSRKTRSTALVSCGAQFQSGFQQPRAAVRLTSRIPEAIEGLLDRRQHVEFGFVALLLDFYAQRVILPQFAQ